MANDPKSTPPSPTDSESAPDPRHVLGSILRAKGNVLQIDFGYFQLKQNNKIVGQVVVSQYTNGVIVPGQSMEYYYLYKASSGSYAPFTWPSVNNTPCSIEYVYTAGGPGPTFDPVAYQYQQPVENQLIACTCVDMGTVKP